MSNRNFYNFTVATPVWEEGSSCEKNITVSFVASVEATDKRVVLAVAASSSFILLVNGEYIAHGPSRCAHGYFNVDEYDISPYMTKELNTVAIRVASYNVNSFSYVNQPGFLCAEIYKGREVIAATGGAGFTAFRVNERVSRVQRYSFQRTFAETYRLSVGAFDYEINPETRAVPTRTAPASAGVFLRRAVPYCDNELIYPVKVIHRGDVSYSDKDSYYNSREISGISERFLGYRESEQEYSSHIQIGKCDMHGQIDTDESPEQISLPRDSYADIEFPYNAAGIFELEISSDGEGELFILFDEILVEGEVVRFRLGISNFITVICKKGAYRLVCSMPHVMKYARLISRGANMTVRNIHLHNEAFPSSLIHADFTGDDEEMKEIYDAAVKTFCANSVDVYMDCPSRERAGWLCDSLFTSRVEYVLTGKSTLEWAFLNNFLLPEHFDDIPNGMLPMCYPADHTDGNFIPNWAMFYALELCEYYERTGDRELVECAREKMYSLLAYFKPFENEYGLLEKLERWVFVEWSHSNNLVQDVSFATNMLYSKMLTSLGELYNDASLKEKAASVKDTINSLAMTESGFYCDNAVRKDGKLVLSGERTEACQYYAFFCDVATPTSHPWLWNTLINEFGYERKKLGSYPEIWFANSFIGNYLRLDLLCRYGYMEELYDNIKGYFGYMAKETGTIWENDTAYASCNHGFASHVAYWIDKLGLLSH